MKKKLVYISHPYSNNEDNLKDIEKIVSYLLKDDKLYENFCFISPVHAFGFMYEYYDKIDYYKGLQLCIDILDHCDIMLMFGDWESSKGCVGEKKYCDEHNIKYITIKTSDELINTSYDTIYEMIQHKLNEGGSTEC